MNTKHPLQSDNGICFYSKVIARSVNTFIPLRDETINSSLVDRGRSLMDPQPHPLALPRANDIECLCSDRQKCGSHKGNDLDCTEDVEVFANQISEVIPH